MLLTTPVDITPSPWRINLDDRLLLLGSCFSDRIADKMRESYLRVTANPTGTLYNPVSIAHHIDDYAPQAEVIIVTFGTAWVYIDKHLSAVVDNCEKRPTSDFIRRRLTVDEIVALWQPILERYKDKRWIFTVSPIRHKKDGLHENQLSKAILLQAVDLLVRLASKDAKGAPTDLRKNSSVPAAGSVGLGATQGASVFEEVLSERTKEPAVHYFPSYEVVLDELRDYRYYAPDMLHPSDVAVDILWERFSTTYFDDTTRHDLRRLHQLWLDEHHRPLHPDTPEAKAFATHLEQEKYELHKLFPNHVTL